MDGEEQKDCRTDSGALVSGTLKNILKTLIYNYSSSVSKKNYKTKKNLITK